MSEFTGAVPTLAALNIKETIAFYNQKLGFGDSFAFPDYGGVSKDQVTIHFWLCKDKYIAENTSCRIQVKNIETLYETYQAQGVIHPNGLLEEKPWNTKEFAVLDNNGNLIWFFQTTAST